MNLLLKSAVIVDPGNTVLHGKKRDILLERGRIQKIAAKITPSKKAKEVRLPNLHVSPGWFDGSVSFGEPGFEERETLGNGLQTAAKSGFTDVVLNTDTYPVPDGSPDMVFLKNRAQGKATNLHPLGCLSAGGKGKDLAELYDMNNSGAVGYYDYKAPISNANLLKIALQYCQSFKGLVHSFPVDSSISGKGVVNEGPVSTRLGLKGIPALAEEIQIARDIFILEYAGGKLHIPTLSTARSVELVAGAKKKGLDISCSVAVHNLWFSDGALEDFDSIYKTAPPLRSKTDIQALIKGVNEGTIDFVVSDHRPLNVELKKVEFDNAAYGTVGLESAFGALNRIFGAEMTVDILTRGKSRYTVEKYPIEEGAMAQLTLFDPDLEYVFERKHINSSSQNSIFLGEKLKGKAYGVVNNGLAILE
ncbi:MAG: dihydroorotase [Bacteroidota bacterium]